MLRVLLGGALLEILAESLSSAVNFVKEVHAFSYSPMKK
jgi:hypothetical protein